MRLLTVALLTSATVQVMTRASSAQTIPVSSLDTEFLVNTTTAGNQNTSNAAMAPDGSYVIAWETSSTGDIWAQRIDALGWKLVSPFQINDIPDASNPTVAIDDSGRFVIAWRKGGSTPDSDIYARRYDASGAALSSGFLVNTITEELQYGANIDRNDSGEFVVVWRHDVGFRSESGIYARRYDENGQPLEMAEFKVNTAPAPDTQADPRVAVAPDGSFVVAWTESSLDLSGSSVYAREFDDAGSPIGDPFQVNITEDDDQHHPDIGIDDQGNYVVTWISKSGAESCLNQPAVVSRVFDGGTAEENCIATLGLSTAEAAAVEMTSSGSFLVSWADPAIGDIMAQAFDLSGTSTSGVLQVNQCTAGDQGGAAIGLADSGTGQSPGREAALPIQATS